MKKINWNIVKLLLLSVVVVFLFAFANSRSMDKNLSSLDISFAEGDAIFITHKTVNKLLIQNHGDVTNIAKEKLDLNSVEKALNSNPMIRSAQVYLAVDGELSSKIEQRKPIARVMSTASFYIDDEGKSMPISNVFTARVPLVTGAIDKNDLKSVFEVLTYLYNDDFLKKSIIGVHVVNKKFQLKLRQSDFVIDLGYARNLNTKFSNFKAFYKKVSKDNTLGRFSRVNLFYSNQVVCTKK